MRYLALSLLLIAVLKFQTNAQQCTGCTTIISTTVTSAVHVNPGDRLCITPTGSLNSTLYLSGGEVCNEGNIGGAIFFYGGTLDNYNTINSGMNILMDSGMFNNYGSIHAAQLSFNGNAITVNNHGPMVGNNLQVQIVNGGGQVIFNNYDSVGVVSYLSDSSSFNNHGVMTTTGQFTNGVDATFYNFGGLQVGANYTNNGYFYTDCMIPVGGLWANNANGIIEGPNSSCAGFTANLSTSNFGSFGADGSYLDMCDSSNMGSFNFNPGITGVNVTYCSCTNYCSNQIPVSVDAMEEDPKMEIFPESYQFCHPLKNTSSQALGMVAICDLLGKDIFHANISESQSRIDISHYPDGIYIVKSQYGNFKFIKE